MFFIVAALLVPESQLEIKNVGLNRTAWEPLML